MGLLVWHERPIRGGRTSAENSFRGAGSSPPREEEEQKVRDEEKNSFHKEGLIFEKESMMHFTWILHLISLKEISTKIPSIFCRLTSSIVTFGATGYENIEIFSGGEK